MKSPRLCFHIILITWKIVNCEVDDSDDAVSAVGFIENAEDTDFVDPHSFNYDRANKKMIDRQAGKFLRSDGICISDGQCRKELKQCRDALDNIEFDRLYTTRLINLLLTAAKFQTEGDLLTGSITLTGTKAQIEELRAFGDGKITMGQIDAILSHMITPTINIFAETLTFLDHLFTVVYRYKWIITAVLATLLVLLLIKLVNWSTGKVVVVFLASAFLFSYFAIWSQLVKEAELKHIITAMKHKKPPIQCDPEKMYIWDRFISYFHESDQCFEYYKAIEFDALHEVTPIDALVETMDRLMLQPAARIGSVFDRFIENATKHLGYPMRWVVTILLYISGVVIIALVILSIFVGRIRLWFGPFCGISIGGGQTNQNHRQPATKEQREPIVYLPAMILERNSDGELRQLASSTVAHSIDDNKFVTGGGDSKTQKQEAKIENSGSICGSCCCKGSLNKSHVQEDEDLVNEATKSEVRSEEKGDGDC